IHPMREDLQIVASSLDPSHYFGLFCGSAPDTCYVYLIARLSKRKRRINHAHAANSSPQRYYDHLAGCRRIVDCRVNRRNSGPTQLSQKEIRLEVRNRGLKKSAGGLRFQIGDTPDAVLLGFERTQRSEKVNPHSRLAAIADIDFDPWPLPGRQQLGERVHFIGRPGEKPDECLQKVENASHRVHQSSRYYVTYGMKLILERSHHTEVAPSSTNCPKKIWIGLLAGLDLSSVHSHHLRRQKVVTGQAVLVHQATFSPAERQPSNSDCRAPA